MSTPNTVSTLKRQTFTTREDVLQLLSDDEVNRVSRAETKVTLEAGDAYLDLEHLEQGVHMSQGQTAHMGFVLPRKAVAQKTWDEILAHLPPMAAGPLPTATPIMGR